MENMVLGVNGIHLVGKPSGAGRALEAVLKAIGDLDHPFEEIRVYTPQPLDGSINIPAFIKNVVLPSKLSPDLWQQFVLPKASDEWDILFCPGDVVPLKVSTPTLFVHRGSYEGYYQEPEGFRDFLASLRARGLHRLSLGHASRIVALSDHSKWELVRFHKLDPDIVEVVPDGVDTKLFRPIKNEEALVHWRRRVFGSDNPFILFVGKPEKRKNIRNLLRAFARIRRVDNLPHKLLLIGMALPGQSFDDDILEMGLEEAVVKVGYASLEELVMAYNACELFVYPSSYEGFGLPVLEAMACGAPVIALDNTALPEFAEGVATLLPNARVETLAHSISTLLADPGRRKKMSEAGPKRATEYDWRRIARRYIELMVDMETVRDELVAVGI